MEKNKESTYKYTASKEVSFLATSANSIYDEMDYIFFECRSYYREKYVGRSDQRGGSRFIIRGNNIVPRYRGNENANQAVKIVKIVKIKVKHK